MKASHADGWVFPALTLVPFVSYLTSHQFPLASVEAAVLSLAGLALGAVLGIICRRIRSRVGFAAIVSALASIALSLVVTDHDRVVAAASLVLFVLLIADRRLVTVLLASALVFAASSVILPVAPPLASFDRARAGADSSADGPALLHVILDAHIGLEGLPDDAAGARFKRDVLDRYLAYGFDVYGGAYSQYRGTTDSLSNTFNYEVNDVPGALIEPAKSPARLSRNTYFAHLSARGYPIRIYQTGYLNFCHGTIAVESCHVYRNSVAALGQMPIALADKLHYLLGDYARRSLYYGLAQRVVRKLHAHTGVDLRFGEVMPNLQPFEALVAFDALAEDIRRAPAGRAYFAHLIAPHHPYLLEQDCQVKPAAKWRDNLPVTDERISEVQFASTYDVYYEQANCIHNKLFSLFDWLRANAAYDRFAIVIHGDHGSRIHYQYPSIERAGRLDQVDFESAFSTFFAVKMPGIKGTYDRHGAPLGELFHAFSGAILDVDAAPPTRRTVLLPDLSGQRLVEVAYPAGR